MVLICVVDDDVSMRSSLGNLLKSLGCHSIGFASGEAFLASAEAAQASCVLLDLRMQGMQGLDVLQHLRASDSHLAVVCMSAHGDQEIVSRVMAAGALAFLAKPFCEEQLIDALELAGIVI
jgi:FixJ family two-component response regulator